ncbi:hypothetical protein MMC18_001583 [Xylographa bjoerkii]|nr:hypothetical protein [Xylographa bjoerkii]
MSSETTEIITAGTAALAVVSRLHEKKCRTKRRMKRLRPSSQSSLSAKPVSACGLDFDSDSDSHVDPGELSTDSDDRGSTNSSSIEDQEDLPAPSTVSSVPSTFNGALEHFAFQSSALTSSIGTRNRSFTTPTPLPRPVKRKAPEQMASSAPKRTTHASVSASPSPQTFAGRNIFTHKRHTAAITSATQPSPVKKTKRASSTYAPPSTYAHLPNLLTDSLAPSLLVLFIGVNPGLRTASSGHAYAHPSNLFWKLLHSSGCTPRRCLPSEDHDLPHLYSLGHTNIVTRATKDAGQLSKAEMDDGVAELEEKVRKWKPEAVCLVGKGIWESVWRVWKGKGIKKEEFKWGWQGEKFAAEDGWDGARIFVATSTSGLAASMRPAEKEAVWRGLGEWVQRRRAERDREKEIETKTEAKKESRNKSGDEGREGCDRRETE